MDFRIWFISLLTITALNWFNVGKTRPPKEINISGDWLFQTGDDFRWKNTAFDDTAWMSITVPSAWENQGYQDYDGIGWYRKHFIVPREWRSENGIAFDIGKIDDDDEVYINGQIIGSGEGWESWRKYQIPIGLVEFGSDNIIAIRVKDTGGNGGIWEGPVKLITELVPNFNPDEY